VNVKQPSTPPNKRALIARLVIIVVVSFAIGEITDYSAFLFHTQKFGRLELAEHALELVLLFFFVYHFVTKPMFKEISRRIAVEEQLRKSESANRAILDALPDTILRVSDEGILIDYRIEAEDVMNLDIGSHVQAMFPVSAERDVMRCLARTLTGGEMQKLEVTIPNGPDEHHQELRFVRSGGNEVLIIISNITERKLYEEKLKYVSTHDPLTELYNRAFYETQLERLGKSRHYPISIIVIDLDGLKDVNDTYGHAAGDKMICKAADVLKKAFRADDLVTRTGGDEFTILLIETDFHALELVVNRINICLVEVNNSESTGQLRFSLGTAVAESRDTFYEAVKLADIRMYEDKASRKSTRQPFDNLPSATPA